MPVRRRFTTLTDSVNHRWSRTGTFESALKTVTFDGSSAAVLQVGAMTCSLALTTSAVSACQQ